MTDNRRKSGRGGTVLITILLVVAIGIFGFAAWKLIGFYKDYKAGSDEYSKLNDEFAAFDGADQDTAEDDGADQDTADGNSPQQVSEGQGAGTSGVPAGTGADGGAAGQAAGENAAAANSSGIGGSLTEEGQAPVNASAGKVLKNVEALENPVTVGKIVAGAATEEKVENGEIKRLPVLRNPIDFEELKGINEDVIGWVRIGALDLSYPIAQGKDNDYYLHRTFRKEDNFAGCIFLNCENSKYFSDQNSIVYGHNMKDGSMFASLKKFRDQELYDKNPYFWIFTPDLIYQYRIFSAAEVPKQGDPYKVRFTSQDYADFLKRMQEQSEVNTEKVKLEDTDRIVTLSTCTGNDETRFIVQGRLEQIYAAK